MTLANSTCVRTGRVDGVWRDDAVADLVAEELRDRALILGLRLPAAVFEGAAGHQFIHERRAVDDGDERVELSDRAQGRSRGVLEGERLRDGERLADTRGLN